MFVEHPLRQEVPIIHIGILLQDLAQVQVKVDEQLFNSIYTFWNLAVNARWVAFKLSNDLGRYQLVIRVKGIMISNFRFRAVAVLLVDFQIWVEVGVRLTTTRGVPGEDCHWLAFAFLPVKESLCWIKLFKLFGGPHV